MSVCGCTLRTRFRRWLMTSWPEALSVLHLATLGHESGWSWKAPGFPHARRRLRLDSKVVRKKLTTPMCFSVELVGQPHIRNIFNGICTTNLTMWVDLFSNDGDFLISNRLIMLFRYLNPPLPEAPSYNSNQVALDRPISQIYQDAWWPKSIGRFLYRHWRTQEGSLRWRMVHLPSAQGLAIEETERISGGSFILLKDIMRNPELE